jgi:hypothetical protein
MTNPFNLSVTALINEALRTYEKGQYNAAQLIIELAILEDNTNLDAKLSYLKILVAIGGNRSMYDYRKNKIKAVNLLNELKKGIINDEFQYDEIQKQKYRETLINYVQFIAFVDNAENEYNPL